MRFDPTPVPSCAGWRGTEIGGRAERVDEHGTRRGVIRRLIGTVVAAWAVGAGPLLVPSWAAGGVPPPAPTTVEELETSTHEHVELVRIRRDFGKPRYLIVLDGWVRRGDVQALEGVRLWWLDRNKKDSRHPLEPFTRRYVELKYRRTGLMAWSVTMRNAGSTYRFDVKADRDGRPRVYAPVVSQEGRDRRCRVVGAMLRARRFLGIPTGVGEVELECAAADGRRFVARMRSE